MGHQLRKLIEQAQGSGGWVLLSNCALAWEKRQRRFGGGGGGEAEGGCCLEPCLDRFSCEKHGLTKCLGILNLPNSNNNSLSQAAA